VRVDAASDEHFHKTPLDAFDRLAFRRKVCRAIDERHADLDEWAKQYNEARIHQGRWCFGKLDRSAARTLKPAQVPCCNSGRLSQWMRDRRGRVTALAVRFMQTVPGPAVAPRTTSLCVGGPIHADHSRTRRRAAHHQPLRGWADSRCCRFSTAA
jgi:hypothetical protein